MVMLPGRQPLEYYFCTGEDLGTVSELPLKPMGIVEAFSIVLLAFVHLRIYVYKNCSAGISNGIRNFLNDMGSISQNSDSTKNFMDNFSSPPHTIFQHI
jgi:hypothetical protein